jgi:uncharacterized protein involved in oxidation of intracellular sulfur
VELDKIHDAKFNVREQAQAVLDAGGEFLACGTCLKPASKDASCCSTSCIASSRCDC